MEKFNELLAKLQNLKIRQTEGYWAEDLPDDIWNQYFDGNFKEVADGLDVDTRRWYETSISVIKIYGGLLGIRYVTNMFSESQSWEDCMVQIEFMEMKEIQKVSYVKKIEI